MQTQKFNQIANEMKELIARRDNGEDIQNEIDRLDAELTKEYIEPKNDNWAIDNAIARMG